MHHYMDPMKGLQLKLINSLKGSATMLTMANDKMYTPEERKAEMEAIERWTHYVRDYEQNVKDLEELRKLRQLGITLENSLDDGR